MGVLLMRGFLISCFNKDFEASEPGIVLDTLARSLELARMPPWSTSLSEDRHIPSTTTQTTVGSGWAQEVTVEEAANSRRWCRRPAFLGLTTSWPTTIRSRAVTDRRHKG